MFFSFLHLDFCSFLTLHGHMDITCKSIRTIPDRVPDIYIKVIALTVYILIFIKLSLKSVLSALLNTYRQIELIIARIDKFETIKSTQIQILIIRY